MSRTKEETASTTSESQTLEILPAMTQSDLLSIIAAMQKSQAESSEAIKALAQAVVESSTPKAPFKSKRDLANEKNEEDARRREKELETYKKKLVQYSQTEGCDHIAGGNQLSEQRDIAGRTSIAWHRNDVGVEQGICTICQRVFLPHQPDYAVWRKRPSFNRLSAAGFRTFMDPRKAMEDSYLHDIE